MTRLRLCPTVEGNAASLITHMIEVETCMSRQRGFYHKCHRCQYRGKSAQWEPVKAVEGEADEATEPTVVVQPAPSPAVRVQA